MTQSLIIDPNEVRRPGYVKFPEVPVNQYTFDRDTEIARYGEKGMVQMLHDMIVVRTDGSPTYNFAVELRAEAGGLHLRFPPLPR